jgi:hypothetical protein
MKLSLKEKYLIILVVLCFISIGFYYSYAIFVTKQLQENVVVVKIDNNRLDLKVNDNDNKISIKSHKSEDIKISLSNSHDTSYFYLVSVKGLTTGVKVSSIDEIEGEILALSKKEIMVHVNNTTDNDIELEFIAKVSNNENIDKDLEYYYINEDDNYDHSGANKPELNGLKLLPVNYRNTSDKEGYWYKSDITNQTDLWYSYENGIWANAVLLSDNNYNKYKDKLVGEIIENSDILGFYVWIPRFKYYVINNSNYTNYERITNIVFEKGNNSTGTIKCDDKISNQNDTHIYSEICYDEVYDHIYDNLSTYTHPAFNNKKGFWVSKFLVGSNEKPLPNVSMLKKDIKEANTISGKHNSHVLTNMEYGAIILLSNSTFGKTGNKMYFTDNDYTFARIYANTYENNVTGCSSDYSNRTKNFITENSNKCITYNDLTNQTHINNSVNYKIGYIGAGASSTGNISGVYDLASIDGEIVAGFIADSNGKSISLKKYDLYSYNDYIGKVSSSKNIYNLYRYKLGDAIRENFRNFCEHGMWNSGTLNQNVNTGIIVRGNEASVYSASIEDIKYQGSFRYVLN